VAGLLFRSRRANAGHAAEGPWLDLGSSVLVPHVESLASPGVDFSSVPLSLLHHPPPCIPSTLRLNSFS